MLLPELLLPEPVLPLLLPEPVPGVLGVEEEPGAVDVPPEEELPEEEAPPDALLFSFRHLSRSAPTMPMHLLGVLALDLQQRSPYPPVST